MSLNNTIIIRLLVLLFFMAYINRSYGQQETYFYKIQDVIAKERSDTAFSIKLDSLKKTRRPNDSYIRVLFNRDVDFGYKHKKNQVEFNTTCNYQINMLTKNDTICFSSVTFNNIFGEPNAYEISFNKKHSIPKMDTIKTLTYLKSRNLFYHSSKTLNDLKNELDSNQWYELSSGDQDVDSREKKHIDTLVKRKDFKELEIMLKSINCETQTYAVRGFDLLKKKKVPIPVKDKIIIDHIKRRNSDLESTAGDVGPIIWKAFK